MFDPIDLVSYEFGFRRSISTWMKKYIIMVLLKKFIVLNHGQRRSIGILVQYWFNT